MGLPHFALLPLLRAVTLGRIVRRFNFPNPITLVLGGGATSRAAIVAIDELAKAKRAVLGRTHQIGVRRESGRKISWRMFEIAQTADAPKRTMVSRPVNGHHHKRYSTMDHRLKIFTTTTFLSLVLANPALAQVAGFATMVVNAETLTAMTEGYSVQKSILQQPVYNDDDKRIGTIDDLIINPDGRVSVAIIGAGQFVGSPRHDVAIHLGHLLSRNGKYVLHGATKEAIRALPEFNYLQ